MDKNILRQFRQESLKQLSKLDPEEIIIFGDPEIPGNYTLVAQPDEHTILRIKELYTQLQAIEPNHYYYPENILHLTLIGNLPLTLDLDKFRQNLPRILKSYNFSFKLCGLGSNIYSSSLSAYPANFFIHELREELRNLAGSHGDDYTSIIKSYEYVGWISYLRYLQKPSPEFLNKLYSYKDTLFGEMNPKIIKLYKTTSNVLSVGKAELIHNFNIY